MASEALSQDAAQPRFAQVMLVVFLPFACGYFFSYLYRSVNAVVSPNLRAEIGLDAADLGLLTAAYFFAFAAFQIPLGVLLDRYGPRRVQATLYCVAAAGALLFALGRDLPELIAARALIGFGAAGGLMAALKAFALWFPRDKLALVNGWYFGSGGLGALFATAPVEWGMGLIGWRGVFMVLAGGTVAAAALIFVTVPEKRGSAAAGSLIEQTRALAAIYRDPFFWRVVPLMFTCASSNMAIQGLWAGPWLADVEGLARDEVARNLFAMALALTVGTLLSGSAAGLLGRFFGVSLGGAAAVGAGLYILVQIVIVLRPGLPPMALWAAFGLTFPLVTVVFAALAQKYPATHLGRVNTAANVLIFSAAFTYQYGLGGIVNLWDKLPTGAYPPMAYVAALTVAIATQAAALTWFLLPRK
jgi:MFS family permease